MGDASDGCPEPVAPVRTLPLLSVSGIHASYGSVRVLHGVTLEVGRGEVGRGEVVCLLGRNGAGKTTTMRVLCGLLAATAGSVLMDGEDVTRASPMRIVEAGLATVPEGRGVFPSMTVRENLALGAYTQRRHARPGRVDFDEVFDLFPRLADRARQMAGTLSGGEQQMLAIARALMARPRILLLDEPSMGLAPMLIDLVFDTIDRLASGGLTILLVEQNAVAALDVSDRAYVIEGGRIVHAGLAGSMLSLPEIQASYLGTAA